uniref:Uncharacterized protein n=1 Tax=Anguilla anguilla TaxID=7936 RepID=A0A0E9S6R3_ANGAN
MSFGKKDTYLGNSYLERLFSPQTSNIELTNISNILTVTVMKA